ncbi:hypothetical protein [Candidatus Methylospira mobilis]|nr:hypothetical protein [Candidatus Methylospira mobilis]
MTERKFISALDVIGGIADRIELPPHFQDKITSTGKISATAAADFWAEHNPKIERMRCISIAARMLKASLSDPKHKTLQTMDKDCMGFHSCAGDKQEILNLLTDAQMWGNNLLSYYCDTFRSAITQGDSVLKTEGNPACYDLLPLINMGFDRVELVSFLNKVGIAHSLAEPQKLTVNQRRDIDFKAWKDATRPAIGEGMTKVLIHEALLQWSSDLSLWCVDFETFKAWWTRSTVVPKLSPGTGKRKTAPT